MRAFCSDGSILKFRYYNLFGKDEDCTLDEETSSIAMNQKVFAKNGECTQIADNVFYKLNVETTEMKLNLQTESD